MKLSDLPERVAGHVSINADTGCWDWTGARSSAGYGTTGWQGVTTSAHRLVYSLLVAPLPKYATSRVQLDHLCRNRSCVNPEHLEPVDNRTNTMRGDRANHKTGVCRNGHDLAQVGAVYDTLGRPRCKECKRLKDERYKRRTRGPLKRLAAGYGDRADARDSA